MGCFLLESHHLFCSLFSSLSNAPLTQNEGNQLGLGLRYSFLRQSFLGDVSSTPHHVPRLGLCDTKTPGSLKPGTCVLG